MELKRIDGEFSVCKIEDITAVNLQAEFWFLGKTDEELSLVCRSVDVPDTVIQKEDGWNAFRIQGVLDFSLIGILSKLSTLLAEAGIGIFAISTFNTDYILTKSSQFESAMTVLKQAGYTVV